jgi:hypothetical protein
VLFAALGAVLVALVIELGAAVAWSLQHGAVFSWRAAAAWRADHGASGATAPGTDAVARAAAQGGVVVHPYVGYVLDASRGGIAGEPVSSWGLLDALPPLRARRDDTWTVGLVGGSVALQLAVLAGDDLAAALGRSAALAGKRVELVRLGLGGWKQPQQLFAVQLLLLLGAHFDCIVVLDGFNEIALGPDNAAAGVPPWFPRGWRSLLDTVPTPAQQQRLGLLALLEEQRRDWLATGERWWWSPTAQLVVASQERRLAARVVDLRAAAERDAGAPSFAATGPGTNAATAADARTQMVDVWRRASLELHALCRAHRIRYAHLLQPNQYVPGSKPIGAEEARVALQPDHPWAGAVRASWGELRAAGEQLRAAGVPFTDLTDVFAANPEPLYVDTCCHLGNKGNALLAAHVAAAVRRELDLHGFAPVALRAEPARVELGSPFTTAPLRVVAVDAAGREVDVTGRALGTAIDAGDAVLARPDGALRALRRGEHRLAVRHGGLVAEVAVAARWPDACASDDAVPAGDGAPPPRLSVVTAGAASAGGADGLELECTGLPTGVIRVLMRSLEPLPPRPPRLGGDAFGVDATSLAADGTVVRTVLPGRLPPGRPLFLRAYAVDGAGEVVAASNALAVTRD